MEKQVGVFDVFYTSIILCIYIYVCIYIDVFGSGPFEEFFFLAVLIVRSETVRSAFCFLSRAQVFSMFSGSTACPIILWPLQFVSGLA